MTDNNTKLNNSVKVNGVADDVTIKTTVKTNISLMFAEKSLFPSSTKFITKQGLFKKIYLTGKL